MNLADLQYPLFLLVVLCGAILLQCLRKKPEEWHRFQRFWILVASYAFLLWVDWRCLICVVAVTLFTFGNALCIDACQELNRRRIALGVGILILVSVLAYFKYTNFFLDGFARVFHFKWETLAIILPLGISFYIFTVLGYLVDVYRRDYSPERNLVIFAIFVAFFPKILSGPIVRGKDFFPQLRKYRGIDSASVLAGIQIFVFGLFKKKVLADHLGVFVDDVFYSPSAFSYGTIILAIISYSLQIYFDFSGYSDMAIGSSRILGIELKPNFNLPYVSKNISDFWGRWHISLSSWFRDYLYIPLGGSRKGTVRCYLNLLCVMLASGLWHGAGWTFVLWGLLHGVASCLHKAVGNSMAKLGALFNIFVTFIMISLFWVVFRADSMQTVYQILRGLFTFQKGICQPYTWSFVSIAFLICATVIARFCSRKERFDKCRGEGIQGYYPIMDLTRWWPKVLFLTEVGLTILLGYYGDTSFIYGAF